MNFSERAPNLSTNERYTSSSVPEAVRVDAETIGRQSLDEFRHVPYEQKLLVGQWKQPEPPRDEVEDIDLRDGMGMAISGLLGPALSIATALLMGDVSFVPAIVTVALVHMGWGFLFGKMWRAQWIQSSLLYKAGFSAAFGVSAAFWITSIVASPFLPIDVLAGVCGFVLGLSNMTHKASEAVHEEGK